MLAMQTLKFWLRPALIVFLWIVTAAFTLSELATVVPLLSSTGATAPRIREPGHRARTAHASNAAVAR
jgi:hypothetical protein